MTITELTAALKAAKAAEDKAKAERLEIEGKIVALYAKPATGEGTHNDEEFSITWKLNRTVDSEKLSAGYESLPVNAQRAFRWKAEVELKNLRALAELDPVSYSAAAEYITSKPAKPSIDLKDKP
jgi:hypothetical protein